MGGGAWPFLVRGLICLVNSDNERDLNLLNSKLSCLLGEGEDLHGPCGCVVVIGSLVISRDYFLEGLSRLTRRKFETITGL